MPSCLIFHRPPAESFGRESKYPPAQSICKLGNKCRSCVRKLSARSGFYLRRAQKNRWTYRTSTGFSPVPAAVERSPENRAFRGLQRVDGGISALSLEIRIVRRKSKKSAEFSNCPQIFWISSGVGFGRRERFRYQKNGDRTDSLERRSKLIDHDRFGRAPVGITEHAESLHLKPVHREMLKSFFDVSRLDRSHPRTAERHPD
jgi:hypothetical protein